MRQLVPIKLAAHQHSKATRVLPCNHLFDAILGPGLQVAQDPRHVVRSLARVRACRRPLLQCAARNRNISFAVMSGSCSHMLRGQSTIASSGSPVAAAQVSEI